MEFSARNFRAIGRIIGSYRRNGALFAAFVCVSAAHAQMNSWTNRTSGNWQDAYWSLGILPGTNQTVWITNSGWKALAIGPETSKEFPQTLTVDSITISSPADSVNTLLLNYAGFQRPLTVRSLSVGSNSAMTLLAASLHIRGPAGVGLSVGGTFTQDAGSLVTGSQMDVGYIGPGVYHLMDGMLTVTQVFLGGVTSNVFIQDGGTNAAGIVHLERGTYLLNDGEYDAVTYFTGGRFVQRGGISRSWAGGDYWLCAGTNFAGAGGTVMQTGGVLLNYVVINGGSYTLSNDVVSVGGMALDGRSSFVQYGGKVVVNGTISTSGKGVGRGSSVDWVHGRYWLAGGTLSCGGMDIPDGYYSQSGGTNVVAGSILLAPYGSGPAPSAVRIYDGTLIVPEIVAGPAGVYGGLVQSGGRIIVSNLTIGSGSPQNLPSQFLQTGGTIRQSGVFRLINVSRLTVAPGKQEFGELQSSGGSLTFASKAATIIHFAGISSNTSLVISNWSGSFAGGGTHQILIGNASEAFMSAPVAGIVFHNPAGVAPGTYLARVLSTGEIVPVAFPAWPTTPWSGGRMWVLPQSNGSLRLDFQGTAGSNYLIQSSWNLVDWAPLTNVGPPDSVLSIQNVWATNGFSRFYRARLIH
jgi:hypothetical protein